jgi:hypothetical protein
MKMEKWDLLKLFQEWGGGKGEWWSGWIKLIHGVSMFVNVTMYPQYNNNIIKHVFFYLLRWNLLSSCSLSEFHLVSYYSFSCSLCFNQELQLHSLPLFIVFEDIKLIPTSGSLHLLFHLPGKLFLMHLWMTRYLFLRFSAKCHFLIETFP